jgi:hypothetical protein
MRIIIPGACPHNAGLSEPEDENQVKALITRLSGAIDTGDLPDTPEDFAETAGTQQEPNTNGED